MLKQQEDDNHAKTQKALEELDLRLKMKQNFSKVQTMVESHCSKYTSLAKTVASSLRALRSRITSRTELAAPGRHSDLGFTPRNVTPGFRSFTRNAISAASTKSELAFLEECQNEFAQNEKLLEDLQESQLALIRGSQFAGEQRFNLLVERLETELSLTRRVLHDLKLAISQQNIILGDEMKREPIVVKLISCLERHYKESKECKTIMNQAEADLERALLNTTLFQFKVRAKSLPARHEAICNPVVKAFMEPSDPEAELVLLSCTEVIKSTANPEFSLFIEFPRSLTPDCTVIFLFYDQHPAHSSLDEERDFVGQVATRLSAITMADKINREVGLLLGDPVDAAQNALLQQQKSLISLQLLDWQSMTSSSQGSNLFYVLLFYLFIYKFI